MSRPEKFFLILSLGGLCLQAVLTCFDPRDFPHLVTTSFLMFLILPPIIILSWLGEWLPAKSAMATESLRMLLMLALIAVVLADKWPKFRSRLHSIIHPSGLRATLFVFVLVILFAYAFPELRGRYPVAYFGIDILIALAMCYFSADEYLTTKKPG